VKIGLRLSVAAAAAVLAVSLTSCDSATEGQPTPEDEVTTSQTSSEEPEPAAPKTFSNTQLCGLLTSDEAQSLGGSPTGEAGYSTSDGSPVCQWNGDTALTVAFQPDKQSKNTQPEPNVTITPTTIAGMTAVQSHRVEPNIDFCQYMVDVTDSTMISGGAAVLSGGEGKYVSCDVAKQFVEIIIPKAMDR
jgi:hypothetical protein